MSPETSAKAARYPRRIGRYEVIQHIGAGGMAAVYKAVDAGLGREVALKVLPPELATRPGLVERFQREAQHAAKLRYKHIVTVYEYGEADGLHFLAMEFVEGINLLEYIVQKGQLDYIEARRILIQGAKALTHAHRQGIVHRDIKPSNFLLKQKEGQLFVKLTDFGLARTKDDGDFQITRAGSTIGTVDYISPEQARNSRSADIRSDIYSLGCTLYHMLTGHPPFPEGDLMERILKRIEEDPPDVREFNPMVPEEMVALLQRMMAKRPEERYQTPAELLSDLKDPFNHSSRTRRELLEELANSNRAVPRHSHRGSVNRPRRDSTGLPRFLGTPVPQDTSLVELPGATKERDEKEQVASFSLSGWKLWALTAGGILLAILILIAVALE